jgi:ribonuclease T1
MGRTGRWPRALAAAALLAGLLAAAPAARAKGPAPRDATVALADLPPEAQRTLALIHRGGPFPYARDGVIFGNYERRLPQRARGYYTEYTVPTPGRRDRAARRIIAGRGSGRDPATSGEYWYTGDHYRSFARIKE